jgi:hypothetical protein
LSHFLPNVNNLKKMSFRNKKEMEIDWWELSTLEGLNVLIHGFGWTGLNSQQRCQTLWCSLNISCLLSSVPLDKCWRTIKQTCLLPDEGLRNLLSDSYR